MSSVVGPQSVPSRISVVLVEETEVRGAVDKAVRSSDSDGPVGTLSPSDSDSVDPVGTLSPSDSASVGPVGMLSPSDSVSVGHDGPDGMLSSSDFAGMLFPAVPAGIPFPVGPDGTLSSSDLAGKLFPAIPAGIPFPAGPDGTMSSSIFAGILIPTIPAGLPFPAGPVGKLSPSDFESAGPVRSCLRLFLLVSCRQGILLVAPLSRRNFQMGGTLLLHSCLPKCLSGITEMLWIWTSLWTFVRLFRM